MAGIANIGCVDMTRALARCCRTVMAFYAIVREIGVVNPCRQPGGRIVANITLAIGLNMVSRLAGGGNAVMAG